MTPWTLLDTTRAPGDGKELRLLQRGEEFSIRVGNQELMNSRIHGSEEALAELAFERIAQRAQARMLIGGLGMGFTLAAALRSLSEQGQAVIAELVPSVIAWNRGPLAALAGRPLEDARVTVHEGDVGQVMRAEQRAFDAILLDVDNGPEGLTRNTNDWLYSLNGLNAAYSALRPGGVLAVWSAGPDRDFTQRLFKVGFDVDEKRVRARGAQGGAHHTIWLAVRAD